MDHVSFNDIGGRKRSNLIQTGCWRMESSTNEPKLGPKRRRE